MPSNTHTVFKIMRRDTGLYAMGGRHVYWHPIGNMWPDTRGLRMHLSLAIPASTRRNSSTELTYGGLPLNEIEIVTFNLVPATHTIMSEDEHVQRKLLHRFDHMLRFNAEYNERQSVQN